jgi:diguanylate cyclase (GGDEF)-like protein
MIDIDYFKLYNDHYGHLAGDACLRTIAAIFKTHARRSTDLVIRYGGEEFILLLPETPLAGALHVAKFIQKSLAIANIPNEASPIAPFITVSMGIASVIPNDKLLNELIAHADKQLYKAKKAGRNRIVG